MPSGDDLPAVIGAGRRRHGVPASPSAAALELDALAAALPPRPRARVSLPRPAWTAAGLYIPTFARGGHEDELSLTIRRSKVSRAHDRELADRLAEAVARAFPGLAPELVVSVPQRPGEEDRFCHIRTSLAARIGAADGGVALTQTRVVAGYRELTTPERRACCAGRFAAHDRVRGRSVLLVDDVVTSGAQASEAIRALEAAGARHGGARGCARALSRMRARHERPISYDGAMSERVVVEVTAFEALGVDEPGSRRALVRWSDGSVGEALRWYDDLCGHPHKSSYAEGRVMPTCTPDPWAAAPKDSPARHSSGVRRRRRAGVLRPAHSGQN